jgi:hypothetical protein
MWSEFGRKLPRFSVRKVRRGIIYQQLFMNESRMIYTPYNISVTTQYSATIQADQRSPLYMAKKKEFDYLWDRADEDGAASVKPTRRKSAKKHARRRR